jgi:hypothetical protein
MAMAFRYFPGETPAWLEAKLRKLNEQEAAGAVNIGGGAGDASYTRQVQASIMETKRKILHDLNVLDPKTYPKADVIAPKATRAVFRA